MTSTPADQEAIAAEAARLTWEPPDAGEWTFDSAHQSSPASATAQELFGPTFEAGFRTCFARFGMPLSHMAMAAVNGWAYSSAFVHGAPRKSSGKQPPKAALKLLVRAPPAARKRAKVAADSIKNGLAMREVERYVAMRPDWVATNLEFQDVDIEGCSDEELADQIRRTAAHLSDGLTLHFELLGQAVVVGEYLVRTGQWGIDPEVAAKAAFHGVQSSAEARERIGAIVAAIGDRDIESLDQVRSAGPDAQEALDEYLRYHGTWILADDVDSATLAEMPHLVVQSINERRGGLVDQTQAIEAAQQLCRDSVPRSDRDEFERLLADTQRAYAALDDNSGILASWPGGLARRAQVAAAGRLVDRGVLTDPDEVWVLRPDEIADLLTGAARPDAEEIAGRVHTRAVQAAATPPPNLGSPPSEPPDPTIFHDPVAQNVRHFFAFMDAKFGSADVPAVGIGDTSVTGRAVVAASADEAIEHVEPGDVLITSYTTPGYNAIFPLLGAVVTITGGPNSHTAVVARELGVTAVIGMSDAFDAIPDGATVTVDPVAATVTIVDNQNG